MTTGPQQTIFLARKHLFSAKTGLKNTQKYVCFDSELLWPRKHENTQKHVCFVAWTLGRLEKHTKTRAFLHMGKNTQKHVFFAFQPLWDTWEAKEATKCPKRLWRYPPGPPRPAYGKPTVTPKVRERPQSDPRDPRGTPTGPQGQPRGSPGSPRGDTREAQEATKCAKRLWR